MNTPKQNINTLLELANHYPSPHNGQPIRIKLTSDTGFEVYFQRERGLQATDISYIFSFVSMGVFMEHFSRSAQALGHELTYLLSLPKETDLRGDGLVRFAKGTIQWQAHQPDGEMRKTLLSRSTSRKKYTEGIDPETARKITEMASTQHMQLTELDDQQARQTIWLNQRAVFDDMFDEPVRRELDHWLRYSQGQKQAMKDGLAYDCMEINGRVMKFIVNHYKLLHVPGISGFLKQYYLRTMVDSSNVFYMLAPFATEQDSFEVGKVIMSIWEIIAAKGYYLHPFGTIMSNHAAHQDFAQMAGIKHESRAENYLVFIFRCGKSEPPTPSLRLAVREHLLLEEDHV